ncbi:glycine betaine ABC transporter substrate-binding protein [uncultured Paracoccus sp.]|uniref:glycine betaine ABC transporter substrate-binding protein n=1 Tax=uncultured Paracoccus sp. TaxID=189685 RepID=UPI0026356F53|nr:glycine betaine ABC transporter substrate-binding protein [uncultured Paracoccus sp.]
MKFVAAACTAVLSSTTYAAAQEECGTVSVAEMNWASAGLAAWVDKVILEEGYDCTVSLVAGDTMPTFTSMNEKAEPDMAPELWLNAVREPLEKAVEEGRLKLTSEILTDGGIEGFWIPRELSEKEGITTLEQALARPELFPGAEDDSKGGFFGCPSGWACQLITRNQFRAVNGEEKGFELIDPGSAAGLDGSIARAFERGEGWLGYYWAPTAILGKYDMVKLDLGVEHDPEMWHSCIVTDDCAEPTLSEWPRSDVFTAVTAQFADKAGVALDYVNARSWSNDTVNTMLSWMSDNQASNEDGAYHFLETQEEIWTKWVPAEVAEKVKAAL